MLFVLFTGLDVHRIQKVWIRPDPDRYLPYVISDHTALPATRHR